MTLDCGEKELDMLALSDSHAFRSEMSEDKSQKTGDLVIPNSFDLTDDHNEVA